MGNKSGHTQTLPSSRFESCGTVTFIGLELSLSYCFNYLMLLLLTCSTDEKERMMWWKGTQRPRFWFQFLHWMAVCLRQIYLIPVGLCFLIFN